MNGRRGFNMRRVDREIKSWDEKLDVLKRADTIRLAIHDDPFPYIVPLSFGFCDNNGQIIIYIHGANEGKKHVLLEKNKNVCVEADIFHRYCETAMGLTAEYESIIGFGTAEIVYGEEAVRGLDMICTHCGFDEYKCDTEMANRTRVYKITLASVTGKRNLIKN